MPQAVQAGVARAFIDDVMRAAGLPAADAARVALSPGSLTGYDYAPSEEPHA